MHWYLNGEKKLFLLKITEQECGTIKYSRFFDFYNSNNY